MIASIIPYRQSGNREAALRLVVDSLSRHTHVVVVEQDEHKRLNIDCDDYLFLYNSGDFNRAWAMNCGVKFKPDFDSYLFIDGDIILDKLSIEHMVNFDNNIIKPYKMLHDVSIDLCRCGRSRPGSLAGGAILLSNSFYNKIGGWDERFEGWGGEDNAMSRLIEKYGGNINRLQYDALHVIHDRTHRNHHRIDINVRMANSYYGHIDTMVNMLKQSNLGDINKYGNQ